MFKNASIIALAFAGSITLWGCSDEDSAQKDLIAAMETATKGYGEAKGDEDKCQKVTEDYKKQCSELKVKYQANAEVNKAENFEDYDENAKEVKEAKKKMKDAEVSCADPKGSSESGTMQVGVHAHQHGGKRSHGHKHSHHVEADASGKGHHKSHARTIPDDEEDE